MRCFLAVPLPEPVRLRLQQLQNRLKRHLEGGRWVAPEGMHLTLRFYGELHPQQVERLVELLQPALAGAGPFPVTLQGLGGFPSPQRARVVWVGVGEGRQQLHDLHARAEQAPERLGLPREERPFVPHVTLARLSRPQPLPPHEVAALAGEELGRFCAQEAVLYESLLFPQGAVYRPVARLCLHNGRGTGILALEN